MTTAAILIAELKSRGARIEAGPAAHQYRVTGFDDEDFEVPALLSLDPVAFEQYLAQAGEGARGAFPELSPVEAAYRLVSMDIEESLTSLSEWVTDIAVTPREILVTRSDRRRWPRPDLAGAPGEYRWTAERPVWDGNDPRGKR